MSAERDAAESGGVDADADLGRSLAGSMFGDELEDALLQAEREQAAEEGAGAAGEESGSNTVDADGRSASPAAPVDDGDHVAAAAGAGIELTAVVADVDGEADGDDLAAGMHSADGGEVGDGHGGLPADEGGDAVEAGEGSEGDDEDEEDADGEDSDDSLFADDSEGEEAEEDESEEDEGEEDSGVDAGAAVADGAADETEEAGEEGLADKRAEQLQDEAEAEAVDMDSDDSAAEDVGTEELGDGAAAAGGVEESKADSHALYSLSDDEGEEADESEEDVASRSFVDNPVLVLARWLLTLGGTGMWEPEALLSFLADNGYGLGQPDDDMLTREQLKLLMRFALQPGNDRPDSDTISQLKSEFRSRALLPVPSAYQLDQWFTSFRNADRSREALHQLALDCVASNAERSGIVKPGSCTDSLSAALAERLAVGSGGEGEGDGEGKEESKGDDDDDASDSKSSDDFKKARARRASAAGPAEGEALTAKRLEGVLELVVPKKALAKKRLSLDGETTAPLRLNDVTMLGDPASASVDAKLLKALTKVVVLDVSGQALQSLPKLDSAMPHLTQLCAERNYLTAVDLGRMEALQVLKLSHNRLTALPALTAPVLRVLELRDNDISGPLTPLRRLLALEELDLGDNLLRWNTADRAEALRFMKASLSGLTRLNLAGNPMFKLTEEARIPGGYPEWRAAVLEGSSCMRFLDLTEDGEPCEVPGRAPPLGCWAAMFAPKPQPMAVIEASERLSTMLAERRYLQASLDSYTTVLDEEAVHFRDELATIGERFQFHRMRSLATRVAALNVRRAFARWSRFRRPEAVEEKRVALDHLRTTFRRTFQRNMRDSFTEWKQLWLLRRLTAGGEVEAGAARMHIDRSNKYASQRILEFCRLIRFKVLGTAWTRWQSKLRDDYSTTLRNQLASWRAAAAEAESRALARQKMLVDRKEELDRKMAAFLPALQDLDALRRRLEAAQTAARSARAEAEEAKARAKAWRQERRQKTVVAVKEVRVVEAEEDSMMWRIG